jgi:multimeric flavodoxin WrbA
MATGHNKAKLKVLALYGSPRRQGNTAQLLEKAVEGVREQGGEVEEILLSDLNMGPCREIYGCKKDGRCVIQDDFQPLYDQIDTCDGIMLASPIFFYGVSAQTKTMMDRCQSFWVRKNWVEKRSGKDKFKRKGLFISAGATHGKKLFDGALLTVRYFFEAVDTELWGKLLYRGLDFEGDVQEHPEYLHEAHATGRQFYTALAESIVRHG